MTEMIKGPVLPMAKTKSPRRAEQIWNTLSGSLSLEDRARIQKGDLKPTERSDWFYVCRAIAWRLFRRRFPQAAAKSA